MSTLRQLQHKSRSTSTPATPTSGFLRPSRPFAPLPTPIFEQAHPVTRAQLGHAVRFGHSLDRISILPPVHSYARMNKAAQSPAIGTMNQIPSMSVSAQPERPSSHAVSDDAQVSLQGAARFEHSFKRSSLFPREKKNNTGLPTQLKADIENLSGMSLDDVHVHYNSSKPAQVQGLAYTQGTDIHVGLGQEQHLAHEAWHVVQQKQGRVKPMMQEKGVAMNDDQGLEREADIIGEQALHMRFPLYPPVQQTRTEQIPGSVVQRKTSVKISGDKINATDTIDQVEHKRDPVHAAAANRAKTLGGWASVPSGEICNHSISYKEIFSAIENHLVGNTIQAGAQQLHEFYTPLAESGNKDAQSENLINSLWTGGAGTADRDQFHNALHYFIYKICDYPGNLFYWPKKTNTEPDYPAPIHIKVRSKAWQPSDPNTFDQTAATEIARLNSGHVELGSIIGGVGS